MRITRRTQNELVVEDSSMWLSCICAACSLVILYFSIAQGKLNGVFGADSSFFLP